MARVPILMYHRVTPLPRGTTVPNHYVHPARFARHVDVLHRTGFTAISLSRMADAFAGRAEMPRRPVVFSFDDGYEHWSQNVVPVLATKGWPGTLFIVSGLMGKDNAWDNRAGDVREALMNPEQVRDAQSKGMEIGGHSVSHARLTKLDDAELARELTACRETLEELTGQPVPYFCYPYGAVDKRVRDAAAAAGYEGATTVAKGLNDPHTDKMLWRRINIRRDTSTPILFWKLLREHLRTTAR